MVLFHAGRFELNMDVIRAGIDTYHKGLAVPLSEEELVLAIFLSMLATAPPVLEETSEGETVN